MKRGKSRLLAGLLSMSMIFSVINAPIEALAATDTSGHWAEASINNWINRGYISGYPDGTFRPNNAISRAEFVTIANKAFGFTSSQGISFSDVKPGYWAYSEIQKGVAAGYVQGDTKGTFRPGSAVSRQEAAVMLARLRGYENDETGAYNYTDRWAMANWAVGAIGAVSRNGVMSGYPDGTFRPQKDLTRAEAVASLQKIANSSNSFGNTGTITNSNYNTNNNSYTPPVYVTTSSNTSSSSNNSSSNTISNTRSSGGRTVLDGTRLENRTLTTDLEIPRSVGSQNVTLKNIRMRGTLYVEGGGTITLENCDIGTVIMDKTDAVLKNNGSSDVEEVRFEQRGRIDGKGYMNVLIDDDSVSEVIIDADIDTLILDADVDLRLYANTNIDTFEITKNADRARIRVGEDAEITEMQIYDKVRISGKGKIDTMTVYVSGVQSSIEPRRLIQQDGARKPSFSYQDDDDDDYDNLVIDDDDEDFDGDGERYDRVRIAAEDVRIRDLTAYDDLIVTSAAGDSTIRIEDVTVKGNVYIEGGGDSSVIFDDCSISGNIYSRKSTSGRYDEPVAIKLRDTSVKGDVYVTGDTILESDEKLNKVILNRELSETFRMDAEAANLTINYKNNVQLRGSKTIDSVDVASGLSNVTLTMNGGKISTLTTRSPIRIDGTGTIDRLLTNQTNDIGSNITVGSTGEVGDDPSAANYTMTSFVSDNSSSYGSISPLGQQTVANGGTMAYTITANSGYHVASIVVDSREINLENKLYSGYTYTFYNVKANHEIIVSFVEGAGTDGTGSASNGTNSGDNNNDNNTPSEDGYRISTNVNGTGGGVSDDFVVVKDGEDASVTFTAENNYHISEIVIDAGTDNEKSLRRISESSETYSKVTYTFVNVTRNHTISATFADGQGTNEVGIRSTDEDAPVIKPSGYKYKVTTMLVGDDGKELVKNTDDRYYCIAGDTVTLRMLNLETDDPNEQYLTTKWSIVNNTTDMRMELTQADNSPHAVLTTTANNGHAVMLRVQVYDTSRESNISAPVYQSDVIELHVDVPMTDLMLSNSDELYCQNYEYVLSSQNFTYIPSTATAANDRQNIQWTIVEEHINDVDPIELQTKKEVRVAQKAMGNGSTVPSLLVEQSQRETADSSQERNITQPIGTVKIRATIPNGKGKMQDFTKEFTIQFIGSKVIPVTALRLNNDDKKKEIFGIADLDLNSIRAEIIPSDATYKQIEWRIASQEGVREELGTIEKDKNYETKLVTNGYPGIIKLRPFIRNGKGAGEDFDPNIDSEEVKVTVKVIEPTVTMNRVVAENGTDIGDIIILSAQVTNAARTPYTEIVRWEKNSKVDSNGNPRESEWKTIDENFLTDEDIDGYKIESPDDNGVYRIGYIVQTDDLNNDNYIPKTLYFRAVVEYDKDYDPNITGVQDKNLAYSTNKISVDCKAQELVFPTKTDSNQSISSRNGISTITGYDTVTLPTIPNSTIRWEIDGVDDTVAKINDDGTKLIVYGKPIGTGAEPQQFVLKATVTKNGVNKGTTSFNIANTSVIVDYKDSEIAVRNAAAFDISSAKPESKIYLTEMTVSPKTAYYNAPVFTDPNKLSWFVGTKIKKENGRDVIEDPEILDITADANGNYEYTIPDDAEGTLYFCAVWKNGGSRSSTTSKLVAVKINTYVSVTGIDFSDTVMGDLPPDPSNPKEYKYTIRKDDYAKDRVQIALAQAKILPTDASVKNNPDTKIEWSITMDDALRNFVTFNNQYNLEIPKNVAETGTQGGTITLTAKVKDGVREGDDFVATLTITVEKTDPIPAPSGGTQTTSTYQPEAIVDEPNNSNATNNAADSNSNATNSNNNATDNSNNATNNATNSNNNATNNVADSDNNATDNTVSNIVDNSNNAINNVADSNNETTGIPDANGFVPVTDISFSSVVGLQPTAQPNVYNVTSNKTQRTLVNLNDIVDEVSGAHTGGVKVLPTNATNQTVTWSVGKGTSVIPSTMTNMTYITSIGRLNKQTGTLNIDENVTGTLVLVATVKNGKGEEIDFTKQITINISPTAVTTPSVPTTPTVTPTTPSTSTTTEPVNQMPENTTQATTRQVVSVGNTQLGTSSTQSTGLSQSKSDVYATDTSTIKSTTSNEDVKIEVSSQAKKGIRIPLKAVSKSTNKEYTDVDWEVKDDGGTDAKIENGNRLRATKAGTVTVQAIVYTSSGDRMVCSTNVTISN